MSLAQRSVLLAERRPYGTLGAWLLIMAGLFLGGNVLGMGKATNTDYGTGEAGRADAVLAQAGLASGAVEYVMVTPGNGDQAAAASAASTIRDELAGDAHVVRVGRPENSARTSAVVVPVEISGDPLTARSRLAEVRETVASAQERLPGMVVEQSGRSTRSAGLDQRRAADLVRTEAITLPVAFLILVIALRSVGQALIPVIGGAVTVFGGLGLSLVGSHLTPDVGVGANVVVLLGLAIAVDYALFFLRERRYAGDDPTVRRERAAHAATTVLRAGVAIVAAAACLYLAGDVVLSSLATNTIAVVIAAMVTSLLGVPAMLTLQERFMAARNRPPYRARAPRTSGGEIAAPVAVRAPRRVLAFTLLGLVVMSIPMFSLRLDTPGSSTFDSSIPQVQAYERFRESFPQMGTSHTVVVEIPPQADQAGASNRVLEAVTRTGAEHGVEPGWVGVTASPDGSTVRAAVGQAAHTDAAEAKALARALRAETAPAIEATIPGAAVLTTGDAAQNEDKVAALLAESPLVLAALLVVITLVTALSFRSIGVAVAGSLMTAVTATATLGVVSFLAQGPFQGFVESFTPDYVAQRVPILLVVMLFGITIDYQYFVLSAIAARRARLPLTEAVAVGLRESRSVIISAAAVMTVIFLSFLGLSLVEMRQIGFALAVSVLIDAFVVRTLLLPSVLTLGWRCGRAAD